MRAEAEAIKAASSKGHLIKVERRHNPCLLEYHGSSVIQAHLNDLRTHFCIPPAISMKALGKGELRWHIRNKLDKIAFLVVELECRVTLSLTPFVSTKRIPSTSAPSFTTFMGEFPSLVHDVA